VTRCRVRVSPSLGFFIVKGTKMKIAGRTVKGPNRVTLVLPRENDEDIIFVAQAVTDMTEFDQYLDMPKPPAHRTPQGVEYNHDDPAYVEQLMTYNLKKMAWLVIKSLEPSEIEWSTVVNENPSTWINYTTELKEAGFSDVEVNRITSIVLQANALDEDKLNAAREVFLRGRVDQKNTSGRSTPVESS